MLSTTISKTKKPSLCESEQVAQPGILHASIRLYIVSELRLSVIILGPSVALRHLDAAVSLIFLTLSRVRIWQSQNPESLSTFSREELVAVSTHRR